MSHSLSKIWIHAVWSTKARQNLIDAEIESRVHRIISDEFALAKCRLMIVNGMPDHIHCLYELEASQSLSNVVR
ncbi:MAG: transposase [Flavobacteriales bacterium]